MPAFCWLACQSAVNNQRQTGSTGATGSSLAGTTTNFAKQLIAKEYQAAHDCLSDSLKQKQPLESIQKLWEETTSGETLKYVESDTGALPSTADEYGITTSVPKSNWVDWEFATVGSDNMLMDIRALVIKENGKLKIEHFEFAPAD